MMTRFANFFKQLFFLSLYSNFIAPRVLQPKWFKAYSFAPIFSFSPFLFFLQVFTFSYFFGEFAGFDIFQQEKAYFRSSNHIRKFFHNRIKIKKFFYFSIYLFMDRNKSFFWRIFSLSFCFIAALTSSFFSFVRLFVFIGFFFFEFVFFLIFFNFNNFFFKFKAILIFYHFKITRKFHDLFLLLLIRSFTRFFSIFFFRNLSKFKSNYSFFMKKLKLFFYYYYSIINVRFFTPRYFKKVFKRFTQNFSFLIKPLLDYQLRKQIFAEEAFIEVFTPESDKSQPVSVAKDKLRSILKPKQKAKGPIVSFVRGIISVPSIFIRYYLTKAFFFFKTFQLSFFYKSHGFFFFSMINNYTTFYLNFFSKEIRFFYYLKTYFSLFNFFGIYFSDFHKSNQLNYLKAFLTTFSFSSRSFFDYLRKSNRFFKNDLMFYVFSQPYVFNFFFPVFSNIFIDSLVQDATIYRADTFYKVYSNYLSEIYYTARVKTNAEANTSGVSKFDEFYEEEYENDDDDEYFDPDFINGNVGYHSEFNNSTIDEDFESEERLLAQPFIRYVTKHHSKNVKKMFSPYSEPTFSDYLDLYEAFNAEYRPELIGTPDSLEYMTYLAHSDLEYYRNSDLHEFFYQYYFSRFYGSSQIDIFFYSFIFPYAFKNFSFSYHLSKFFKVIFFDSINYTYQSYFGFFYLAPVTSFFKLYFHLPFSKANLPIKHFSSFSKFTFFKHFYFSKILFYIKNIFYGYFYFLKTTAIQRDLDFQTTYNRLYDLKQNTQIAEIGEVNPTYDLTTTEDEDEDPDYINYYFFENFEDDYDTLIFEDDDFFHEDTENEQFYHNYVFSDDFIKPFLSDDEFQQSVEYSISIDDSFYNSNSYVINEQFEFELNEISLSELIAQGIHINFLNNFFVDVLFANTKYFNHIDPVLDVDFALDYHSEEIKSDYVEQFDNPPQFEQDDAFSIPNDKKSLIIIKNLSELYNDRLTKWLVKNKNFNLKPLPPFLFGIGRYIPSSTSSGFLRFSDLQINFSRYTKTKTLDLFSILHSPDKFKPYYNVQKFDKDFLRNFFLLFQSPVHLFPKDSYLSIVIVFHLLTKSFSFDHSDFLSPEIQLQSQLYFFDGVMAHSIFSHEINFGAVFETSSHFVPDQDFEVQILLHLRTLRPTTLLYLREKYFSILDLTNDSSGNTIGDSDSYHAQWGFFPSYTSSPTNYFFYHMSKLAPRFLHKDDSYNPGFSSSFFPFFKRYKIKADKFPKTKWARKFYSEPELKDYPKFRIPFLKLKYKQLDNYRIKKKARYVSKWYRFFRLDFEKIYNEDGPKATSFFSFIYFFNYSLFFAFNHLKDDFFFYYSLVQTSIARQYRINPLVYQTYRLRPNSSKNTYFIFDTYYANYLLHLNKKLKARQIRHLRANPTLLKRFGFDPEFTFQTINDKKRKIFERRRQLRNQKKLRKKTPFRYNYYFNVLGEDLDDAAQHTNISLLYERPNYWFSRLKLDNFDSSYTFNHQHYSPSNAQFFDLSTIDFFYSNESNPFASIFFKSTSFSFFKTFDLYLQPYQYTFPIGNYYFDCSFYPEEETNIDFNIFDFYIIDEAEELTDTSVDPAEYEDTLPLEFEDMNYNLNLESKFSSDETIDGTSDIQTSEYQIEGDDDYLILPYEDERGYRQEVDGEASYATDLFGFGDLPEDDANNDYNFEESDLIDFDFKDTAMFSGDLYGIPDSEDQNLYDQLYEDNYQHVDFSELDDVDDLNGINYLQQTFIFDKRFIDPFLAAHFNRYGMNPKISYPASTFLHFRSRPLRDNDNEELKTFLKRKLYILRNIEKKQDRKPFLRALKFPKKLRKTIKFRNTKYYLRYLHFSALINSNKPFYTSSFPLYNSFDIDFQLTSVIDDKFDIEFPIDQTENYDAELLDNLDTQLREDFLSYLDQDNDDLDPDFFDFSSYTSVPISRFFFGYAKSNVSPFVTSDPRFVISSNDEFKFINSSSFSSSFSQSDTSLASGSDSFSNSVSSYKFIKFSIFYTFFRLIFSFFVKFYLSLKIFLIYHILHNKPEFQVITNFDFLSFHYISNFKNYNADFFKSYYNFISSWNFHLTSTPLSLIRFDYFKNFFNPTYYTSKDTNFSNLFASKFSAEDDSEYLHLNFFVETELYTTLLINQKIEKILADRIQIPVFFWNYDDYFLYMLNSFDEYEYNINFDIQEGNVNQSQQNINTNFSDDAVEHSDIYEEIFENTKQLYISRIEIFFEAFGQLLFIGFFGLYNLLKNFFFFLKINHTAFSLYTETAWLSLYLRHGSFVYFFRLFLSVNVFCIIVLYVFFNLPYLIFYFNPFITTFSYLAFISVILMFTFLVMGFTIFKSFRFFFSSLDQDERIALFFCSIFLWFYNVYLGYIYNPSLSVRFTNDDLYNSPTDMRFFLLTRRNSQPRYRRPVFPFQNENLPFPAFRPHSYSQNPYKLIFSPTYELSLQPYAFGLPPEPNQTFVNFSKNLFFRSLGNFRELPIFKSSSYGRLLKPDKIRPTSKFISSTSNPIIDSFFRNRNRKLKRYRLFAVTVLPYEKHSFWSAEITRENRLNSETFGFPTRGLFNPVHSLSDSISYSFLDVYSKRTSDYVYYPTVRTRKVRKLARFIKKFYRKFKITSSRRSILTRFVPSMHDDPRFRKFLLKHHSYKPFKYKLIPNYERTKYLRNIIRGYSKSSRTGIAKIFKKEFQFDPRYKQRKRRAKGGLRHKILLSRFENRQNIQQFVKPYAFFPPENARQKQKFIVNYSPFTSNLHSRNTKSIFFLYRNLGVSQTHFPDSTKGYSSDSKIPKFIRSRNLNVNTVIDQKLTSSPYPAFGLNFQEDKSNFPVSLTNYENLKIFNAQSNFEITFPYLLYYANLERIGSTLYSKQYVYELSKRFSTQNRQTYKFSNFYKFNLFPQHYKFQIFFSNTYSNFYRFFLSPNYISRTTFLFSTLLSSSPVAETTLKRIRYKRRINTFNHFFKARFNRLYLRAAKKLNIDNSPTLITVFPLSVLNVGQYTPSSNFLGPKMSEKITTRRYRGVSDSVLTYTHYRDFNPHTYQFDHPFSIYFSSFGQDWYQLFRAKTGFNFFSNDSKNKRFGYYPISLTSRNYSPYSLNFFSSLVHSDKNNLFNFEKRVRDLVSFRYSFNKFLNNRQKFISNFSSNAVLPIYSNSNYLNSIIFSLYSFKPFYVPQTTRYPVSDPNFFSSFSQSATHVSDSFNPFLTTFDFQQTFNLSPYYFSSNNFDFVFDRSSFYSPGTKSFLQLQSRLTAARYSLNFTKLFNKKVQIPFRFLQNQVVEGAFIAPLSQLYSNRRARKIFGSGRFKESTLFSKSYHLGLQNRRTMLLNKRRSNPKYRFKISERRFLRNKLNVFNSLEATAGFLGSERDFFYHSLLSFKPLPAYFFQDSSISFGKNRRPRRKSYSISAFPFDIFSKVYFDNHSSKFLYPKRVRASVNSSFESSRIRIRRLGKRPSTRLYPFFKRRRISHNRPISGYRSRFFLSKYFKS